MYKPSVLDEMEMALVSMKQALAMGHTEAVERIIVDMEWMIQRLRVREKENIPA
jgi:hypothetical protein